MALKVYVAGASKEIDRCARWIAALEHAGVQITHNWTVQVRQAMAKNIGDGPYRTREEKIQHARTDFNAVAAADIVWMLYPLWPTNWTRGAFYELGYAQGCIDWRPEEFGGGDPQHEILRPVVVISGPGGATDGPVDDDIFAHLIARHIFHHDADAFEFIFRQYQDQEERRAAP